MKVSGYYSNPNNQTGSGYGFRISKKDRYRFFKEAWTSVILELDTGEVFEVRVTPSFWRQCPELRDSRIGKWMLNLGLAPWPSGKPPRLTLEPRENRRFYLSRT